MRRAILFCIVMLFASVALGAVEHGCATLGVTAAPDGAIGTTFSVRATSDVDVWVLFPPGAANRYQDDHEVEFRLTTPRGFLYESRPIPFTADQSKKGKSRPFHGQPVDVEYRILGPGPKGANQQIGVSIRLPLAGTPVSQSSLYGTWKAEALIDHDTQPCSKALTFSIAP